MARITTYLIFISAALLEVSGDAIIRKGLRGRGVFIVMLGFIMLGCYGISVNLVKWDFSKMLGVYIAIFALISVLFGRFVFHESIPFSMWIGLMMIMAGGAVIQFGNRF